MTDLYDRERPVRDDDGDQVVFGLRDERVYVDIHQENGLLIFSPARFAVFLSAGAEALAEAQARAPGESVG